MARWLQIEDALDVKVYFCDPALAVAAAVGPVRLAIIEDSSTPWSSSSMTGTQPTV